MVASLISRADLGRAYSSVCVDARDAGPEPFGTKNTKQTPAAANFKDLNPVFGVPFEMLHDQKAEFQNLLPWIAASWPSRFSFRILGEMS